MATDYSARKRAYQQQEGNCEVDDDDDDSSPYFTASALFRRKTASFSSSSSSYDGDEHDPVPLDLTAPTKKQKLLVSENKKLTANNFSSSSSPSSSQQDGPLDLRLVGTSNTDKTPSSPGLSSSFSKSITTPPIIDNDDGEEDEDEEDNRKFFENFLAGTRDDDEDDEDDDDDDEAFDELISSQSDDQSTHSGGHEVMARRKKTAGHQVGTGAASSVIDSSSFFRCSGQSSESCQTVGEHWHCRLCIDPTLSSVAFVRREDIERHQRRHFRHQLWLSRGFLRCTPSERANCLRAFPKCPHSHQTHYHCLQCSRSYVNTYEVQLHAASHRKETAIALDGFKRFRATDNCGNPTCPYFSAHTTHFHCTRQDCGYAFKVKADMEKHKIYHQRDDDYVREGFRKFMKYQACPFVSQGCSLSNSSNHIHCLRCGYVLHSSGQLNSHRRKHDREDAEQRPGNNNNNVANHHQVPQPQPQQILLTQPKMTPGSTVTPLSSANNLRSAFQPIISSVVDSITMLRNRQTNGANTRQTASVQPVFQSIKQNNSRNNNSNVAIATVNERQRSNRPNSYQGVVKPLSSYEKNKAVVPSAPRYQQQEACPALLEASDYEIKPSLSSAGEMCETQQHCIYSGRGIVHYHCPLPVGVQQICSCSFTRLATLKLHLKAVHNQNTIVTVGDDQLLLKRSGINKAPDR